MKKRKSLLALLVVLLIGASLYLALRINRVQSSSGSNGAAGIVEPPVTRSFPGVERSLAEQTLWRKELLAEQHEEVFIKLWDNLRTQENPLSVLEQFAFGELVLGTFAEKITNDHQIVTARSVPPLRRLKPAAWRQLLSHLKDQGYQLQQSEWRHPEFVVATNGPMQSVIAMTLHVLRREPEERFIVRGNLRIVWRRNVAAGSPPFPEEIDAGDLELLSRRGELPFQNVLVSDLTPENRKSKSLDAMLQVYDLDGDGLSEIILMRSNIVLWNQGKGVFRAERFLPDAPENLHTGILADFDGDGVVDFLAADADGLVLFSGGAKGQFSGPGRRTRFTDQPLQNPFVVTAGDIDNDGDLDLWLGQYKVPYEKGQMPTPYYDANDGHPAFLLINDGRGNFRDATDAAGLAAKRFRRSYSASFADLDNDGDLDLVVVSDFAGADVYFNDGHGRFTDVTGQALDQRHLFGMAHTFGDYDLDGELDLFVIGMNSFVAERLDRLGLGRPQFPEHNQMRSKMAYGNRLYFKRNVRFQQTDLSKEVSRTGWSWGATTGDFDNDGAPDIYVVNGHISGKTALDYETQFWTHDIYAASSKDDAALETYFRLTGSKHYAAGHSYGGFEKNRLFLNQSGRHFLEAAYLMGVALEQDCRSVVADDLNGDGKLDLLVTTVSVWPGARQELRILPNFMPDAGNWIGVQLREGAAGFSPVGAKVILTTPRRTQVQQFVTGDSYRSQHATTAHFGLGSEQSVKNIEVIWSNGQRRILRDPSINQYHRVPPPAKD